VCESIFCLPNFKSSYTLGFTPAMTNEHDFGEPYSSLAFGGDEFGFSMNLGDGFDCAYIPNNEDQTHQISLFDDIIFDDAPNQDEKKILFR